MSTSSVGEKSDHRIDGKNLGEDGEGTMIRDVSKDHKSGNKEYIHSISTSRHSVS